MPEYLSKEEIKHWRSSLEKITLEEYAVRLGKTIEEEKKTNDLIDIVFKGQAGMTLRDDLTITKGERLNTIAQRAFEREKEISHTQNTHFAAAEKKMREAKLLKEKSEKSEKLEKAEASKKVEEFVSKSSDDSLKEEVRLVFKKALTDREQMVFDYFAQNKNTIVYAKDLAKLLDLPRDYVYKYIKNLRAKIEGENLQNADNGGYVLNA